MGSRLDAVDPGTFSWAADGVYTLLPAMVLDGDEEPARAKEKHVYKSVKHISGVEVPSS